jgi:hypothetical protein
MLASDANKNARGFPISTKEQQAKIYINPNNPAPALAPAQYVRIIHHPKPFYKKPLFIGGGIFTIFILALIGFLKLRNNKTQS